MRHTASALNRGWLAVLGLVFLIAGLVGVAVATGQARRFAPSLPLPGSTTPLAGTGWDAPWVPAAVAGAGVVLAVLGLAWLIAQIPRKHEAKPLRLQDTADTGLTWCEPGVVTDAVEAHTKTLPGVTAASAVLRGHAARPELTVQVTATERTDIAKLVDQIRTTVAGGVETALDAPVSRLGIQVEISRTAKTVSEISV